MAAGLWYVRVATLSLSLSLSLSSLAYLLTEWSMRSLQERTNGSAFRRLDVPRNDSIIPLSSIREGTAAIKATIERRALIHSLTRRSLAAVCMYLAARMDCVTFRSTASVLALGLRYTWRAIGVGLRMDGLTRCACAMARTQVRTNGPDPEPRWGHTAVVARGKMWILGGCDSVINFNHFYPYHFSTFSR